MRRLDNTYDQACLKEPLPVSVTGRGSLSFEVYNYRGYGLCCVIIYLLMGEVMTMTVIEHKKYIEQMDDYIKKITEEPREKSLDFLNKAGIVDKDGKLMPQYQKQ